MTLVDGIPSEQVSAADRGLHYGDGLFETMRLYEGRVPLLARHLTRLRAGCEVLGLVWPGDEVLSGDVARLAHPGGEGVIKLLLTRGAGGRGYTPDPGAAARRIATRYPLSSPAGGRMEVGLCETRLGRNTRLAGLKHLSRLEQVLAAAEVAAAGWDEGLMLDEHGRVIEATRHNLFLVRDDGIVTPRLDGSGVAGVMRALVMDRCQTVNMDCSEDDLTPEDLAGAGEAFLTNAVAGVVAVTGLCGRPLAAGPVTEALMRGLSGREVPWLAA